MYESGWEPILPSYFVDFAYCLADFLAAKRRPQVVPAPPAHCWYTLYIPSGQAEAAERQAIRDAIAARPQG